MIEKVDKINVRSVSTFFTPSLTKILAILIISSAVSKCEFGVRVMPSSGIQY